MKRGSMLLRCAPCTHQTTTTQPNNLYPCSSNITTWPPPAQAQAQPRGHILPWDLLKESWRAGTCGVGLVQAERSAESQWAPPRWGSGRAGEHNVLTQEAPRTYSRSSVHELASFLKHNFECRLRLRSCSCIAAVYTQAMSAPCALPPDSSRPSRSPARLRAGQRWHLQICVVAGSITVQAPMARPEPSLWKLQLTLQNEPLRQKRWNECGSNAPTTLTEGASVAASVPAHPARRCTGPGP